MSYRNWEEFVKQVENHIPQSFQVDPEQAATSVFGVLTRHVTPEQVAKVRQALPEEVRERWPESMPVGHSITE
jgi:uncharacterized protein (DUF2267 family)